MNLESAVHFLQRLYDKPENHNFTRLEHEALGVAIRRLSEILEGEEKEKTKTKIRELRNKE